MPASQQSFGTASHRNILLLEEYDALAAAIGSALRKFAPEHATSVARSLREGETLAAKLDPELFVMDVDPPWIGMAEFLEKMRTAHPEARVLVIGTAIPLEISAERRSFGALQFISKPFELAAFGAAVQALLGPWRQPESATPRGSLASLNAIDIILLHCTASASIMLELGAKGGSSGKIQLLEGDISHAEAGVNTGIEALRDILSWPDAHVTGATSSISRRRTIHRNWVPALVEAIRATTARQLPPPLPSQKAPPQKPSPKTGQKIVVVDDTEMLLIFVEDVLATADPELQITTALTGLDGIKEIKRVVPDLVLLDYSLPDINGDEVCQRLLEDEGTAHVPILMMSGHVAEMAATAKRFENVVATIEKPFLSDALVLRVRQTLAAGPRQPRPKSIPTPPEKTVRPTKPRKPEKNRPPVAPEIPLPITTPFAPAILEAPELPLARTTVRAIAGEANEAVLGLFLEVISLQLTPQLQMGTIRARPASLTVSLHLPSSARNAVGGEIGFQLGPTDLNHNGKISTVRLIPTTKPFQPAETRNAFQIGGVTVIPNETRTRVQLTPAGTTPMTMQLLAHLELDAVELSPTFQVAQLALKWRTNAVRVTLSSKPAELNGAVFEATSVKLDASSRIAELLLSPPA